MSNLPHFIVLYAGMPIRLPSLDLATENTASRFVSVKDALFEVYRANLNPAWCRVVLVRDDVEVVPTDERTAQRTGLTSKTERLCDVHEKRFPTGSGVAGG